MFGQTYGFMTYFTFPEGVEHTGEVWKRKEGQVDWPDHDQRLNERFPSHFYNVKSYHQTYFWIFCRQTFTWAWLGRIWRFWWRGPGCPRNRWTGVSGHNQCCPSSCCGKRQIVWEGRAKKDDPKRWYEPNLERQSTISPDARTASTPSTEPCRLPYLHHFLHIWASMRRYISCLSKRKPPALVLTLPPIWQLPWKHHFIICHKYFVSTLAPRSRGTIIPWSAKAESSVSRTTPAWIWYLCVYHSETYIYVLCKLVYFSISGMYLTDSDSSTWVNTLNIGHQPSWYDHLNVTIVHWYEFCSETDLVKHRNTATHQTGVAALTTR